MYDDEDEPQSKTPAGWFLRYGVIILAIFLCYIFYRDKFEPVNLFWTYTFAILIFVYFLKATYTAFKHVSPKGIFYPHVTTTIGEPLTTAGVWNIYTSNDVFTGISIKKGGEGLHWRGGAPTIVTPMQSDNAIGRNRIGLCEHKEVGLKDLPACVVEKVIQYGLQPPYWLGLADVSQYGEDVNIEDLPDDIKKMLGKKGKLTKVDVDSLRTLLEEYFKLTNTYKGLYEEMKQKVEEMKDMIRRLSLKEDISARDKAMSYLFGRAGEQRREEVR